jgi:hypothetical protein
VIVDEIDIEYISILEPENDAPVRADRDSPKALQLTLQHMKTKSRLIQCFYRSYGIERGQYPADAIDHVRRKLPVVILFIEPLESFVAKGLDHPSSVK